MARNLLAATVCGTKHAAIPADLSNPSILCLKSLFHKS
jgi:hypothetical protein